MSRLNWLKIANDNFDENEVSEPCIYSEDFRSEPYEEDGVLMVDIVNYKGELESSELFSEFSHLPVFISKYNYR